MHPDFDRANYGENSACYNRIFTVSLVMPDYSQVGMVRVTDPFLHFGAQAISLERMKLDISNLVCLLKVKSTGITRVKVLQYGGAFRSRDLLKFWEICANIVRNSKK